jgi:hypothetical protein
MTAWESDTNQIVEQIAGIEGMRDNIEVQDDCVTTYIPIDRLDAAEGFEGMSVEVLEEYEHDT